MVVLFMRMLWFAQSRVFSSYRYPAYSHGLLQSKRECLYQLPFLVIRASRSIWSCFSSLILEVYPVHCYGNSE